MPDGNWERVQEVFLEAADLPAVERARFLDRACLDDPALRRDVEALLRGDAGGASGVEEAIEAEAASVLEEPSFVGARLGPYRLVEEIGRGGMGAVFLAERDDDQFHKLVAVKVVKHGMDTQEVLGRFRHERQILAGLEHPNIARLLDGGTTPDGRPFLVMERVEGQSIETYCRERALDVESILRLFLRVCEAVSYAHRALVVHRDLKPGNILVNGEGVPKLLDFGVAKLLGPDGGPGLTSTVYGVGPLTPEYASPEQVRGLPVTTATDVYSLGAILFELLTGTRAQKIETHTPREIDRVVCETEPPWLSVAARAGGLGRRLNSDLDNIVAMAMRKERERRYSSVGQLAGDLRRYLDGRPVKARPDSFGYRAGKFIQRNRLPVAAAALVVGSLVAGVAVSLHQARIARERFDLVRNLANRFLFDFHGEIANLSGSTKAQQMVVNTAVEYLDKLSTTAGSDRGLLQDMAEAYSKLSSVQGGSSTSNAARYEDALVSQRRSVEFYRRLTAIDPSKRAKLAVSLIDLSRIEQLLAREAPGLEHAREGLAILDGLLAAGSNDAKLLGQTAGAHLYVSRSLLSSGKVAEALPANLMAQRYYERVLEIQTTSGMQYNLAITQRDEGQMYIASGDVEKGIAVLERSLGTIEKLVAAEPRNRAYQRVLMTQMESLGTAYYSSERLSAGDPRMALTFLKKRRELSRKLLESDPADSVAQMDAAAAESSSAEALAEIDPLQAAEFARLAMARWNGLPVTGNGVFVLTNRFRAARRLAAALLASGRTREAVASSREAVGIMRELVAKKPNDEGYQKLAVLALTTLGQTLAAAGQDSEARTAYQEAASWGEKLLAAESGLPSLTLVAVDAFDRYGDYWKSRGEREQARHWFERSRQAWAARPEHTPAVEQRRKEAEERLNALEP